MHSVLLTNRRKIGWSKGSVILWPLFLHKLIFPDKETEENCSSVVFAFTSSSSDFLCLLSLLFLSHKVMHHEHAAYWFLKQWDSNSREWHLSTHGQLYEWVHMHVQPTKHSYTQTCICGNKYNLVTSTGLREQFYINLASTRLKD